VKGWQKIYKTCGNQKQERIAILISDKADFIQKSVRRDKEFHCILTKGTIQEEDIIKISICFEHWSPYVHKKQNKTKNTSKLKGTDMTR
jgi:hypothetical protein